MKITVFGAGALGSVVGGLLSRRNEVTLIARPEHAEAVVREGLRITGQIEETFHPQAVESVSDLPVQDIVLITTKAYDTEVAAAQVAPLAGKGTVVASLQNGMGNGDVLKAYFGDRAVVGVPYLGATYLRPGVVRLAGLGVSFIGPVKGNERLATHVAEALSACGIPAQATSDIEPAVWLKTIVNASINPLTALIKKENGSILGSADLLDICRSACLEGGLAAKANAIDLGVRDPFDKVKEVLGTTAGNRSSMLQDVERGKRTEIDQINGALVRRGEDKGVPMPVNRMLWEMVRSL